MRNHMIRLRADLAYSSNVLFMGAASGITSATIPTHAVGDLIIIAVTRLAGTSNTITNPGGYTAIPGLSTIGIESSGSGLFLRVGYFYKVASSTSEVTGTWTGASTVTAVVIRGQHASPFGGVANGNMGFASLTARYLSVTIAATGRANYLLALASCSNAATSLETPPAGLQNVHNSLINSTHEVSVHGAKKVGVWAQADVVCSGTPGAMPTATIEILSS